MLESLGWLPEVALNGIEALRVANLLKPALVLLDINMPKLDGLDTCGVLRAQAWSRNTRIIATTGLSGDEIVERAKQMGFDDYLVKPITLEALERVTIPWPAHQD
jgi:CheY-like chemotaxis protein